MYFRSRYKPELPSFQLAPMIDIVFLLASFFIVTQIYSQWETEVDITLPTAQTGALPERLPGEIIINIQKEGQVVVNQRSFDDTALLDLLKRIVEQFAGQPVLIRADKRTAYEHVIRVLDLCRQAEIWNISFATSFVEPEPGRP